MTDYEQVYDEAWSGMVGRDRNELHAAGIAAVVAAAKTDALIEAAEKISRHLLRNPRPDINNPAHVYAAHRIEVADDLLAFAATYRTPGGTENG